VREKAQPANRPRGRRSRGGAPGWRHRRPRRRWSSWCCWPQPSLAIAITSVAAAYAAAISVIVMYGVQIDADGGLAAIDDPSGSMAWVPNTGAFQLPVLAFWVVFAGRLVLTWPARAFPDAWSGSPPDLQIFSAWCAGGSGGVKATAHEERRLAMVVPVQADGHAGRCDGGDRQ
jgi:hypothetical protein